MEKKAFTNISKQAEKAIAEQRIHNAIELTRAIIRDLPGSQLLEEINAVATDYAAMLHFIEQGGSDPQLQTSVNAIAQRLIGILQTAVIQWIISKPFSAYGRIVKSLTSNSAISFDDISDQLRRIVRSKEGRPIYYEALDTAFGLLWALPLPEECDAKLADRIGRLDSFAQLVLTSAVTMGALEVFSPVRIRLLLRLAEVAINAYKQIPSDNETDSTPEQTESEENAADTDDAHPSSNDIETDFCVRTLMGLIFVHRRWQKFLCYYDDLNSALHTLICERVPHEMLLLINNALTRAGLTKEVEEKMDEFMPAIGKAIEKRIKRQAKDEEGDNEGKPGGRKNNKPFRVEVISIDASEDEKMGALFIQHARRLSKLREEGYDSNYNSFKQMSPRFKFFEQPAHFFYPFSVKIPFVKDAIEKRGTPKLSLGIIEGNRFCDTDCYSYISMVEYLDEKSEELSNFLNKQFSEIEEMVTMPESYRGLDSYNNYAQMCYRYLHLSQNNEDFAAVIELDKETLMPLLEPYSQCFTEVEDVVTQLETMLWMRASEQALAVVNRIQERCGATAELLRDKGDALMQMDRFRLAVEALSQAQLLDEDADTAHDIAQCHEAMGQWKQAVAQLEAAEQMDSELNYAEEIAYCLIKDGCWDEAANRLFQVEFEGRSTKNIQRAIGWCSLHQGKYARAEQYYSGLTQQRNSIWNDHLNLGHALWLQGKRAEAIASYRTFVKAFNKAKNKEDFEFWQEAFNTDVAELFTGHTSPTEAAVLVEAIAL